MTVQELLNLLHSLPPDRLITPVHVVTGDFHSGEQRWDAASTVTVGTIKGLDGSIPGKPRDPDDIWSDACKVVFIRGMHAELVGSEVEG